MKILLYPNEWMDPRWSYHSVILSSSRKQYSSHESSHFILAQNIIHNIYSTLYLRFNFFRQPIDEKKGHSLHELEYDNNFSI